MSRFTETAISRQDFLKKLRNFGAVTVAGVAVSAEIFQDAERSKEHPTVSTSHAEYIFCYENHDKPLKKSEFPTDVDLAMIETVDPLLDTNKDELPDILRHWGRNAMTFDDGEPFVDYLARNGIAMTFCDVSHARTALQIAEEKSQRSLWAISWNLAAAALVDWWQKREQETQGAPHQGKEKMNRSQFLTIMKRAFLTFGILNIPSALNGLDIHNVQGQRTAPRRVLQRIQGLGSNADISDGLLFFRNLMTAIRGDFVAEYEQERLGRKPRIAMKVGASHSGLEDLIRLGREGCIAILNALPPDLLDTLLAYAGTAQELSTIRILYSDGRGFSQDAFIRDKQLRQFLQTKNLSRG